MYPQIRATERSSYLSKATQLRTESGIPGFLIPHSRSCGHHEHPLERWMDSCRGLRAPDQREGIVETSVQEDEIAFNPEIPSFQEDLGQPRRFPAGSPLFCSMRSGTSILEFTF